MSGSLTFHPRYHRSPYPARRLRASESTLRLDSCPVCGATKLEPIATVAAADGEPVLERSRCPDCTFVTFTRRPDGEWYRAFYESAWDPSGAVPPDSNYDAIASILLPFLPDQNARILEIGCGYGGALETMRRHGYHRLYGLEASRRRAEHARSRGFAVALCSAEELLTDPVIAEGAPYDAVFSWHVFEHLYDPALAVDNLASLLRPGGVVFICVPHVEAEHLFFMSHYLPHIHSYSERSLSTLFERRGFSVEHVDDSLRLVARKATAPAPRPVTVADRPMHNKFVRDFGLRSLQLPFAGEAVLTYSPYRGSNEILEPSFGSMTALSRAGRLKRVLGHARAGVIGLHADEPAGSAAARPAHLFRELALRTIGRSWNQAVGEVRVDAAASAQDPVDHLQVVYPGDHILALVK